MAGTVPALFLHTQKTAGSSLVHLARRYYGASLTSHGDCWGKAPAQIRNIGFISGHIGYHYARHLMPTRYTFTFLRDPKERILSMYYFCRVRDPAEFEIYGRAHNMSLIEFLNSGFTDPWVKKNIWNNQVWQLAHGYAHLDNRTIDDFGETELLELAKEHVREFSHVGFTETFKSDSARILQALGFPVTKDVPISNATPHRPKFAQQSPEVKELLARLTELDRELYDYAFSFATSKRAKRGW